MAPLLLCFVSHMRDFLAVLTGRGRSRAPLEAGIQSVRLCLAARDSCRLGAFREIAPPIPVATPV